MCLAHARKGGCNGRFLYQTCPTGVSPIAIPPFDLDQTNPLNTALVSTYPPNERTFRENVEDWMDFEHGSASGRHKIPTGNDAARDAITDWEAGSLWISTQGTLPSLQINNGTKATPDWESVTGITNVGDLVIGVAAGMAVRLAIGASGRILQSDGTVPAWVAKSITTRGDTLRGDSSGVEERLAIGAAGSALISDGTDISWGTPSGGVIQVVNNTDGAVATTTTAFPDDDTIPQITEGGEFMTRAITPGDTANLLVIDVVVIGGHSGANVVGVGLFQDATVGALASCRVHSATSDRAINAVFRHVMLAGTTSATTFRVRAGGASGTFTFNGVDSGRKHGGVMASSITVTEIKA